MGEMWEQQMQELGLGRSRVLIYQMGHDVEWMGRLGSLDMHMLQNIEVLVN